MISQTEQNILRLLFNTPMIRGVEIVHALKIDVFVLVEAVQLLCKKNLINQPLLVNNVKSTLVSHYYIVPSCVNRAKQLAGLS